VAAVKPRVAENNMEGSN